MKMENDSLKSAILNIGREGNLYLWGQIIAVVFNYSFSIIMSNLLEPSLLGKYFIGISMLSVLEAITVFSLKPAIIRYCSAYYQSRDIEKLSSYFSGSFIISFLLTLISFFILYFYSNFLAVRIFKNSQVSLVIKYIAVILPFTVLINHFIFLTQAFKLSKITVLFQNILQPFLKLTLCSSLVLLGLKLKGALSGLLFSFVISAFILSHIIFKKYFIPLKFNFSIKFDVIKIIILYSLPLFLSNFLLVLGQQIHILLLGSLSNSVQVSYFGIPLRISLFTTIALTSISTIFNPYISIYTKNRNREDLKNLLKLVTRWIFFISSPIFMIFLIYSEEILRIFGESYVNAKYIFYLLLIGQIFNVLVGPVGYLITLSGYSKLTFLNIFISFILETVLNVVLIPKYGAFGAAITYSCITIFLNLLRITQTRILFKFTSFSKNQFIILAISSLIVVFVKLLKIQYFGNFNYNFILISLIFTIILYLLSLRALKWDSEDSFLINYLREKIQLKIRR